MTMEETNINYPIVEMNGCEYLKICHSEDVFEGKGRRVRIDDDIDRQVAVFRVEGKLYCLYNVCPHRHADRIFEGYIKDMTVMCPLHGWTYSLETGENVNKHQGLKGLDKYEVFEKDGWVYIEKPDIKIPKWRRED